MEFVSKTQHYLKVKKPLLERQRRARINKCLDALKTLVAEFQGDDAILRMDKAEMLEATITFMRSKATQAPSETLKRMKMGPSSVESYRFGYMNAVNEVSRVMALTPGMNVEMGKAVMSRLGCEFNRLLQPVDLSTVKMKPQYATIDNKKMRPMSPASSGYHSENEENSPLPSPADKQLWRPW